MGSEQTVKVPVSIWKEETARKSKSDSEIQKEETATDIRNTRISKLREALDTTIYFRSNSQCRNANGDIVQCDTRKSPDEQWPVYDYPTLAPVEAAQWHLYDPLTPVTATQRAYLNDINRIAYKADAGEELKIERTWRTSQ